jgi:hypothetical protein
MNNNVLVKKNNKHFKYNPDVDQKKEQMIKERAQFENKPINYQNKIWKGVSSSINGSVVQDNREFLLARDIKDEQKITSDINNELGAREREEKINEEKRQKLMATIATMNIAMEDEICGEETEMYKDMKVGATESNMEKFASNINDLIDEISKI